ncbi:TrmH family RNA methyltransferase [Patescibacteria group bacterium]|nr:MAG: TrmH family RNA methyltransferase [Patescibacteria group bacterium]
MHMNLVIIAHNIRSAYNIGAIFRAADGMGAKKIYLTGYSACPHTEKYVYLRPHEKMISKTALGAEKSIAWVYFKSIGQALKGLKSEGFEIVALEQHPSSIPYSKYRPAGKVAMVVGNEPRGIDARILRQCDRIIEIPMRGQKNSLNVAVALGVAGYGILEADARRNTKQKICHSKRNKR